MSRALALLLLASTWWGLVSCTDAPPPGAGAVTAGVRFPSLETIPEAPRRPPGR